MTFEEWELLAKQGIAEAQYNLGLMSSKGKEDDPGTDCRCSGTYKKVAKETLEPLN